MRRSQISFLLTIATTLLLLLGLLAGWILAAWTSQGSPTDRAWQVGTVLLVLGIIGTLFWLRRFQQLYFFRIKMLVDDAQLILQANPDRRLTPDGPPDIRALVVLLNDYATHFQQLQSERDKEVQQARADLEEERNLLATLMAELSDGVVVCNREGRILLYNVQARTLLSAGHKDAGEAPAVIAGGYVGLGRSIFGLLDRNALTYGLSHLQKATTAPADQQRAALAPAHKTDASFITMTTGGTLLRTHMMPLLTREGELRGFVLTLHDMTQRLAASSRRDFLLQRLTERMRGGLGNIRAAIELLEQFPTMPPEQLQRFQGVIDEEATTLSGELDQTMRDFAEDLRAQWRFEEIAGSDLL
ncbi:MAG: hypothetical protein KDE19_23120, partial [Caldilineaceae bacterium]|nr:hypothetical protein [Caldilineaceae bacterium]